MLLFLLRKAIIDINSVHMLNQIFYFEVTGIFNGSYVMSLWKFNLSPKDSCSVYFSGSELFAARALLFMANYT